MCERKRLQVFLHKCFQISCYLLFVFTSYMDGDCVSALDAETHQGKHFAGIRFLAVLFNRDSARNGCLCLLDQHAGWTCMKSLRVSDCVCKTFQCDTLLLVYLFSRGCCHAQCIKQLRCQHILHI